MSEGLLMRLETSEQMNLEDLYSYNFDYSGFSEFEILATSI
jgi:hypothetical protein